MKRGIAVRIGHSLSFKTGIAVFLVSLLFFSTLFGVMFGQAVQLLREQTIVNTGVSLEMLKQYLTLVLENEMSAMYAFDTAELASIENALQGEEYLKREYSGNSSTMRILIRDGEVLAIDSPSWLYGIHVDTSVYKALSRRGRTVVTEPYYSKLSAYRVVAMIRSVVNYETNGEDLIVSEINTNYLFSYISNYLPSEQALVVLNATGDTVYFDPYNRILDKENVASSGLLELPGELKSSLLLANDGETELKAGNHRYIVQRLRHQNGWLFCLLIDADSFDEQLNGRVQFFWIIAAFAVLVLIVTSVLLSVSLLHPVRKLAKQFDEMAGMDSAVIKGKWQQDEIGILKSSFNRLIMRLAASNEAHMQAEKEKNQLAYSVLQSQIQPHFLFNIHGCCQSLMKEERYEDAERMLSSFDSLLRMSFSEEQTIPLEKEIVLCEQYVLINKIRFGDTFEFLCSGWEPLKDVLVPKLLIQPILENALFHGLLGLRHKGIISLTVMSTQDEMHIIVEDNGCGIPEEKLKLIREGQQGALSGTHGMVSIGLDNVTRRVKSFFGEESDVWIASREGIGTTVEIVARLSGEAKVQTSSDE